MALGDIKKKKGDLLVIPKKALGTKYRKIGEGSEGIVYNYNNEYALKIFTYLNDGTSPYRYNKKIEKINYIIDNDFNIEGCSLPYGLVSFNGEDIEGYYTKLIRSGLDINFLNKTTNRGMLKEKLILADIILQRLHSNGFIVGDVKANNIMLDEDNEPIFIDTDNYKVGPYQFDIIPFMITRCCVLLDKKIPDKDIDIFWYSVLAVSLLTGINFYNYLNMSDLNNGVDLLDESKDVKDGLKEIFSDSTNKPYVGPILRKMKK